MKFRICIVTMTPALVVDAAAMALANCTLPSESVELLIAANSHCLLPWPAEFDRPRGGKAGKLSVMHFPDNEGVVPAMHKIWSDVHEETRGLDDGTSDYLAYIHDDCLMLSEGWDAKVVDLFRRKPECDVVGFVGGTGIGAHDIYQSPYQMIQLGRHNVHSNMINAEAHGRRATTEMQLATCDGCGFVVRRSLLDRLAGWSTWWPEPNHGYDNAIACMLRRLGRQMWLCPVLFEHPSPLKLSGKHLNATAMQRHNDRFGTDQQVHARAHERLYNEFRDVLPFHVG